MALAGNDGNARPQDDLLMRSEALENAFHFHFQMQIVLSNSNCQISVRAKACEMSEAQDIGG
jgi:hypothetical protein